MDATFFKSPTEWREWLAANGEGATELLLGFYKKGSGKGGISYTQAVDEALAYGWIDGIRRRIDEASYSNRFSPRKPSSNWSAVNIKRVEELTELGRMQPAGLAAFARRDERKSKIYSYENEERTFSPEHEEQFRANKAAWDYFQSQAPSYRRAAIYWVVSAKREETREKRLLELITVSEQGRRLGHLSYGVQPHS